VRKPDVGASALVAVLVLLLFYRVGFPQYQMVPFVLGSAWLLRHWDRLRNRAALIAAMALYFGCFTVLDVVYMLSDAWNVVVDWESLQDTGGLLTFLLGLAFLGSVVAALPPEDPDVVSRPHASGMMA
jgi:hypothetical protein